MATTDKYQRNTLAEAVAGSHTWNDLMRRLGLKPSGGQRRELRLAVPSATSYADLMRALKLDVNDTNHRRIRRKVAELGLDTSHFTRRPWGSVQTSPRTAMREKVLVVLPPGSARPNRARLHAALQDSGIPCQCATCGNPGQWLGQPITLQIDHINGDWLDNRVENLRYLCPNCHALTATWCRQKVGRRTKHPDPPVH